MPKDKETLEKVVKEKIGPIIVDTTKKAIGATVEELNKTLIDRIASASPVVFDINTSLPYKKAKKTFRKKFFAQLIETHYGNVSDVAKITGIDRRTIHRVIKELGIDVEKIRQNLLNPNHYMKMTVENIMKRTIEEYKPIIAQERLDRVYESLPKLEQELMSSLPNTEMTYDEAEEEFDRQYFSKAIKENGFNVSLTARKIGLRYETLHRKLKMLGLAKV